MVTNVYPLKGSLQGGTKLTITGLGFGTNESLVEVDVGDFMCDIQDLSNSQIICQIEEAVTVHSVTNLGTHKGMISVLNLTIFPLTLGILRNFSFVFCCKGIEEKDNTNIDIITFLTIYDGCHLLSHLLMHFCNLYCKQYGPRSDCFLKNSLIRVHVFTFY